MVQTINIRGEWADMLTHVPVSSAEKASLRARMAEPHRHYHDARHLALLWARHKHFGEGHVATTGIWHQRMACAIAYHDIVYEPARKDNEARSVAAWEASGVEMDEVGRAWVSSAIASTADHLGAQQQADEPDVDWTVRLWMLDLDLTPLGEPRAVFDANTQDLRREFSHLTAEDWETRRFAFLKGLLAHPALYRTPVIAAEFADRARENLERETADK